MPAPRPEIADLLKVDIPPGGKVITVSDLHLPPDRTDVSGRSCETLARQLDAETGPLTVVLAGDVVELLGFPEATATDILRAHEDLCTALAAVTARGGQVIYAIGNHDGDLAWDVKAADAVREMTGARLCLSADLILPDGRKVRVEHGHQLDPYNCFHDPRNALDTPLGHHIVREVIPKIEWLGQGWVDGAHEMADPTDFPSFIGSRLVYRKFGRRLWWLIAIPLAILILVRIPVVTSIRTRYPDTDVWVHRGEILGYGAIADLVMLAVVVGHPGPPGLGVSQRAGSGAAGLRPEPRRAPAGRRPGRRRLPRLHLGPHAPPGAGRHRVRLLRQLRLVHLGRGGDRRAVRPAAGLRAEPAGLLGRAGRGEGGAGLGPGRAAGREPDGTLRRAGPQPALGHPGVRRLLAAGPTGPRRTGRPSGRSPSSAIPGRGNCARTRNHARPRGLLSRVRRPWLPRW